MCDARMRRKIGIFLERNWKGFIFREKSRIAD